jgi:hypothetical protein
MSGYTLSTMTSLALQDLFDETNARWQASDIQRALDRAVDRYSEYYPCIAELDMQMQPYQRTYPYPQSWSPNYPVLWIEKILYPLQVYGSYFNPPANAPSAAKASGSGLSSGVYQYVITYLTQGGETPASPAVSVTTTSGQQTVNLTDIPVGPNNPVSPGVATNYIIGRNIYRTAVGGSTFYYLTSIPDNTTTSCVDTTADASLNVDASPPTVNTSGVMLWPPRERDFAEYSNMFDSNIALAAGGNMGLMGAVGDTGQPQTGNSSPSFTLRLNPMELPKDNTLVMRVFYATKHQLDSNGSTFPEVHRDVITLGACAYAMEAYMTPTADNFQFADGGLRDHVDDSMISGNWLALAQNRMKQFTDRLEEIKEQRDYASSSIAHWGEIPRFYWRL